MQFIQTIHDAAKYGDEDAAEKMLADGVDVNKKVCPGFAL